MKSRMVRIASLAVVGTLALGACANRGGSEESSSENYPEKSLTMVVHAGAGGGSDLTARTLAKELEADLGQSIVVENRTGGGGRVGLTYLKERPADGYAIGFIPVEVAMLGHQGADIKPEQYTILGQVMNAPATLSVPANSPYRTLDQFLAAAKAKPESITVANSGAGAIWEAATLALGEAAGATFKPVPYDGGAPAVAAGVSGEVQAVMAGVSESATAARDGRLRVLAVLAPERVTSLPDVPTAKELGQDVVIGGWGLIGAPAGLPADVKEKLAAAVQKAASSTTFKDVMTKAGNTPMATSPDEATTFARSEYDRFGEIY
ncbi:tripartite tricarboxylate transporter substrate binding protein [Micromonospora sagamiensis]|uniref:Tripartite-type tricarboxylate transporter receptor subunit TctC n=1 Tax=Micromonospora sagamiensis TaxID=47875 RepID=A0A562WGK4_9ACTN|nr:tripartite tricarboxylate transporter substrate binding protein [Micromonospora sagamiensis]TWJ29027.1 tripartite-type tricarboxylate transporter receptor subunit TctC [Micromonospora sagamiensis]BCL17948.1 ABC transporter substrate-binding protein [Micromonospora sagamiensis]